MNLTTILPHVVLVFRSRSWACVTLLACLIGHAPSAAAAPPEQPPEQLVEKTRARIDEARAKFDKEADAVDAEVHKRLDRLAERARRQGDHETLTKIDAQRKAYDASHKDVPPIIQAADLLRRRARAVEQMVSAYDRAISDLTRFDLRAEADGMAAEKKTFLERDGAAVESQASALLLPGSVWTGRRAHDPGLGGRETGVTLHIDHRDGTKFTGHIEFEGRAYDISGTIVGDAVKFENRPNGDDPLQQSFVGKIQGEELSFRYEGASMKNTPVRGEGSVKLQTRGKPVTP